MAGRTVFNTGTAPTGAGGQNSPEAWQALNEMTAELYATRSGVVAGGAGYRDVSGAVEIDLSEGDIHLLRVVGSVTSITAINAPSTDAVAMAFRLVLLIDAVGGHSISGQFAVSEWIDGADWPDLNLEANARNILDFQLLPGETIGAYVTNGDVARDPYKLSFGADGEQYIATEEEEIDLASYTQPFGNGTITFQKSAGGDPFGANISARTLFAVGDTLKVTCTGKTVAGPVRIPRYDPSA